MKWISFAILIFCLFEWISYTTLKFCLSKWINFVIFSFFLSKWISSKLHTFKFLAFDSCLWNFNFLVNYLFIKSWNWFVWNLKWFHSLIRIILLTNVNLFFYSFHYKKSWFSKRFNLTKMSTLTERMFILTKNMDHEKHMVFLLVFLIKMTILTKC
jgi:hypothetical protein